MLVCYSMLNKMVIHVWFTIYIIVTYILTDDLMTLYVHLKFNGGALFDFSKSCSFVAWTRQIKSWARKMCRRHIIYAYTYIYPRTEWCLIQVCVRAPAAANPHPPTALQKRRSLLRAQFVCMCARPCFIMLLQIITAAARARINGRQEFFLYLKRQHAQW